MKTTTMNITAMHRISGVDACAPAGTFLAPTAWSFQGTGPSTSARLRYLGADAIAVATIAKKSTDVVRARSGEPPV